MGNESKDRLDIDDANVIAQRIEVMHAHTISKIRQENSRLNVLDNESIEQLFHRYSGIKYSAAWLNDDKVTIQEFISWATTAPCDLLLKNIQNNEGQI